MKNKYLVMSLIVACAFLIMPELAMASVESSMMALQQKLLGTILPLLSVLALLFAGLAYLTGSPNARSYLIASIIGAAIAFGAESIVSLIRSVVH